MSRQSNIQLPKIIEDDGTIKTERGSFAIVPVSPLDGGASPHISDEDMKLVRAVLLEYYGQITERSHTLPTTSGFYWFGRGNRDGNIAKVTIRPDESTARMVFFGTPNQSYDLNSISGDDWWFSGPIRQPQAE